MISFKQNTPGEASNEHGAAQDLFWTNIELSVNVHQYNRMISESKYDWYTKRQQK